MISRTLVIFLALGAAVYRFMTGATIEAVGLLGLGGGLIFLRLAERRPQMRRLAYLCFLATAAIIGYVLYRNSR